MIEMTSKQRKILEKAAHDMEPVVIVGQNGVTESVCNMIGEQLKHHELIKVKFNEFKDEKRDLANEVAVDNNATLVRIIGNVAILYKESEDPEKRQYARSLSKAK